MVPLGTGLAGLVFMVHVLTSSAYPMREAPSARRLPVPESLGSFSDSEPVKAEELSFRDVIDAVNPLNHIPIVSDLFADATGHEPAPVAKLAGGALLGGPLGFIASLANVIFEEVTGATPVKTMLAGLTDEPLEATKKPTELAQAEVTSAPAGSGGFLLAAAATPAPVASPADSSDTRSAILSLYGASTPSAHASYRQAQLRPYLNDVTVSRVL